ncbi:SpoVR family protein [Planctomycetes bacterium Poly30]|uniref:SpoVR family protein n=1 Tax=Saltatorellus ferox TaxID=2528018 RepID=A0A518ES42_9BACT|nr:SpoVR family protein [Planctomycetes bacterium Poly30]
MEAAELAETVATAAGLTFFDVVFEMLDAVDVNALAAYGGFPTRYPSWRFGMEYECLARGHEWGLSKIYELVINHDPTIAYLVRSNSFMEQKLVMAHVYGHADFFRNSAWFAPTDRRMIQRFEQHARCIKEHSARLGQDRVEEFLDAALSLDTLIDPYGAQRRMRARQSSGGMPDVAGGHRSGQGALARASRDRLNALQGEEPLPDPPEQQQAVGSPFDVLGYLAEFAEVEAWQRDILRIAAYEAEYFAPQRMTKIINEGWASFWHSRLLTGGLLDASEVIEFADCHAGATASAPGQLNPYKLGIDLFRHAEEQGLDIFRLRAVHNDVSFIDAVVDEAFVRRSKLFAMEPGSGPGRKPVIGSRDADEIKGRLLSSLAWGGLPRIRMESAPAAGSSGALVLRHEHDGRDLKLDEAGVLLRTVGRMWKGPVELLTQEGEEGRRLLCDKGELSLREAS